MNSMLAGAPWNAPGAIQPASTMPALSRGSWPSVNKPFVVYPPAE
jgi:hypothetical protein